MSKNRIRLDICGIECTLGSDDSESYIRSIAEEVEKAITAMQRQNEHLSTAAAAVFASLNFCDDAHKAQASADNLRTQIRVYVEEASRARLEADEARREIERLNRELQTLRARWNAESEDGEEGGSEPEEKPAPRRQKAQQHPAERAGQRDRREEEPPTPEEDAEKGFLSFFEKKDGEE